MELPKGTKGKMITLSELKGRVKNNYYGSKLDPSVVPHREFMKDLADRHFAWRNDLAKVFRLDIHQVNFVLRLSRYQLQPGDEKFREKQLEFIETLLNTLGCRKPPIKPTPNFYYPH